MRNNSFDFKTPVNMLKFKKKVEMMGKGEGNTPLWVFDPVPFNPKSFTIEAKVVFPEGMTLPKGLFEFNSRFNYNRIAISLYSNLVHLFVTNDAGDGGVEHTTSVPSAGTHIFTLKCNESVFKSYRNGVLIDSTNNPQLPDYVGIGGFNGQYYGNNILNQANFENLQLIVSRERTEEEIIKRGNPANNQFKIDDKVLFAIKNPLNNSYYTFNKYKPIKQDGIVANNPNYYEAWPSIDKLSNQEYVVIYRTATANVHAFEPSGKLVIKKSRDGVHWGDEITAAKMGTNLDNRTGGILIFNDENNDDKETILISLNTSETHSYVTKSVDEGETWTTPQLVSQNRGTVGNPILLSNGDIIFSTYDGLGHVYIERSDDGGETWTESLICYDATNITTEASLLEIKTDNTFSGDVLALVRSDIGPYKKFFSEDYGNEWDSGVTEILSSALTSTRIMLRRLSSNKIGVIYPYSSGIMIGISTDEGGTWSKTFPITHDDVINSYPDFVVNNNEICAVGCYNKATSDIKSTRIMLSMII